MVQDVFARPRLRPCFAADCRTGARVVAQISGFLPAAPAGNKSAKGPVLSDPDRVLVRLDSYVDAYGARATLYELWTQNPALFELLLLLFDRSEFLAETAIRTPDLVDELELSGRLRRQKSADETLRDLRRGAGDADQRLWLRCYHQAELMRIGLRDILGLADYAQNLLELSALADACLQYALEAVMRQAKLKSAPLCVVGLGKLGGREINYGSDLDILFVTNADPKNLPQLQRVAVEFLDLLGSQTELGAVFHLDARLRPDGEKGLLVNTIEACEEYYRRRAGLWEIQALTRVRPIAGDLQAGAQFQQLAAALANFTPENVAAGFVAPATRGKKAGRLVRLHARLEKGNRRHARAHCPGTNAVGQGSFGHQDRHGRIDRRRIFGASLLPGPRLARGKHMERLATRRRIRPCFPSATTALLLQNYGQLQRIEGILRRWSYEGETVLPDDDPALRRVAVRCGYAGPEDFMQSVDAMRAAIRSVYVKYFRGHASP